MARGEFKKIAKIPFVGTIHQGDMKIVTFSFAVGFIAGYMFRKIFR